MGNLSIEHEAVTDKKHAKVPWKSEGFGETKAQRTQPPDYTDIIIIIRADQPRVSQHFFTLFKKL